jgi:PAS domain S-box-containing protein
MQARKPAGGGARVSNPTMVREQPSPATAPLMRDDTILELLPLAVYVCDTEGRVVRHNRKAAEFWERTPRLGDLSELFCGSHRLFWPDGRPMTRDDSPMADAIRHGRSHRDLEIRIRQPSGRVIWALANIDPIKNDAGMITGAVNCFRDITERKDAEQKLRDSQELLRTVVETTPECMKIVARDGTLVHMNPAGLRMVEADAAETVEGASTFNLIAPEHREDWRAHHERVCDGARLTWEFDIISLRGTRRHMETRAAPLRLPNGTTAQLAITRDISQRKRDEGVLRDSERRLRELLEALPSAVYTTDAEGRIKFFNRAAVEMSGRTPRLGQDQWCVTWRLYRPDGTPLPHDQCPMAIALKERRPIRGEEAVAERPDGTRVPFIPYPTPLFDAEGNLVGAINMLVDITDRKRAEEYSQRLASIVENSDDAIISKDTNGIINSWNKGAENLFGYVADEVIGKPINVLIPPERQDEEPDIIARIRRGERIGHYETVRARKDGSLVDISLTVSPLRNASGRVIGASKIARDISNRRREEERRQLLVNELNHRVKNTLTTVQSLAAQTFRGKSHDKATKQFEGRLIALSRAHDILTRESWEGADLHELVREVTAAICLEPDARFEISGLTLRIRPKMALSLSMAIHELCTNAAKYGALSNHSGRIQITWTIDRPDKAPWLHVRWLESGGPRVKKPTHQGFGTRLLERALARELDAAVRLSFPPAGAVCEIDAPLA